MTVLIHTMDLFFDQLGNDRITVDWILMGLFLDSDLT